MDEFQERREHDEWRESLRPLKGDSGYAQAYTSYVNRKARRARGELLGMFSLICTIALLIVAFKFGWFQEAALLIVLGIGAYVVSIPVRKLISLRRQDELYNAAVDRKNGIDKRWGRHGSKGKKNNARN